MSIKMLLWLPRCSCATALLLSTWLLSCSGWPGGTGQNDTGTDGQTGQQTVIRQDQIAQLPKWQRELLEDPGWEMPEIVPPSPTKLTPPSREMIAELFASQELLDRIPAPQDFPRLTSSWNKNASQAGGIEIGEYPFGPPDIVPDYGCNSDPDNSSPAGNAIEDIIGQYQSEIPPVTYVNNGSARANHFAAGGSGTDMLSSVYQLFSDDLVEIDANWFEISYNAGLLGTGIGPGGDCSPVSAAGGPFRVEGEIWRRFNADLSATPYRNPTKLFNVLIAPSGEVSAPLGTEGNSVATYQPFYFGSVSKCYGDAWIVSIESTNSGCETFANFFSDPETAPTAQAFFTNPVYGLLLKRWQDMQLVGQAGPWESEIGMPVFGPFAYSNGAQLLNGKGEHYAWGEFYERGFIWWVDYDNDGVDAGYPNATDEAVAYRFSGENIYCSEAGEWLVLQTMYYGNNGELSTNVIPLGWRIAGNIEWTPMDFQGTRYEIVLPTNQQLDVEVQLFAQGFGGVPNSDFQYKHYTWVFGNGFVQPPGPDYDPQQQHATATYSFVEGETQTRYSIKVQVVDEEGFSFANSFPLVFSRLPEE